MNKEELRQAWEKFTEGNDFMLNPDKAHVDFVIDGVLKLEKEKGFRYCPCRLTTGEREKDLKLLCPCNFKIQETWKNRGDCWCGLFVKR